MTPKQLEQLPASLSRLYMDLELDIMKEITITIRNVSKLEHTQYLIERAFVLGIGEKDIKSMINRTTRLTQKEVDTLVTDAIKIDYESLREIYNQKGVDYIPFEDNEILQQQIATIKAQTLGECKNITNTLGFASEKGGTVVFNDLTSFYQSTMDKVVLQVSTGAFDYTTAMTRAVKSMTQSGLRTIDYASGAKNKVEVATRRSLMTGITQLSGQVSLSNASKLGIETFEVTAHGGARNTGSGYLNHAGWQGKVYTLKQLEEICGYGQGGGLKGWNCRHDFYPFDEEFSPRMYPDSELKELEKQENTKTEYKGEKYTTYEATQAQRKLETRMRYQRQNMELMDAAGLDSLQSEKALYQRTKQEYIQFSKAMDMPTQFERVNVDGLGSIGNWKTQNLKNNALKNTNASDLSSDLKKTLTEYTDGKYSNICDYSQYIVDKTATRFSTTEWFEKNILTGITEKDMENTRKILKIIDEQPTNKHKLYRLETGINKASEGDVLNMGIRSTTRDSKFVEKVYTGKMEGFNELKNNGDFTEYRIIGSKSLDISNISVYKNQKEELIYGKYKVVKTETIKPIIGEIHNTEIPISKVAKNVEPFISKTGKEMVKYTHEGKNFTDTIEKFSNRTMEIEERKIPQFGRKIIWIKKI